MIHALERQDSVSHVRQIIPGGKDQIARLPCRLELRVERLERAELNRFASDGHYSPETTNRRKPGEGREIQTHLGHSSARKLAEHLKQQKLNNGIWRTL